MLQPFANPEERKAFALFRVWIHQRAEALRAKKASESLTDSTIVESPPDSTGEISPVEFPPTTTGKDGKQYPATESNNEQPD